LLAVIDEIAHIGEKLGARLNANAAVQFFDSVPETMQSSMQHDAASGRAIEIEAIGGAILRAATQTGIPAPVTTMLVDELRQIEPQ
jgi:2-dehydropantoate 2-reductase